MKPAKNGHKLPYRLKGRIRQNFTSKRFCDNPKAEKEVSAEQRLNQLEQAFRQGRQEYLNLFKACPEALVYTNIDGIVLYANRCFEELTGYPEDELKGNALAYCLKPQEKAFFETDGNGFIETMIQGRDLHKLAVRIGRRYNETENRLAGIIFSFRDISRHKRERKLNSNLFRISQITASDMSLEEMFPLVHEQLAEIIDATNFYIALSGFEEEPLSFPYYTDEAAGDDETFINRYCSSQSIFHYILQTKKPVLMDFQRYRKMLSYGYIEPWDVMTNTHLWLGVPLKINSQIIGVIALQSYDNARLYNEKDIDLLEFVSQQLSAAIFRLKMVEDPTELPPEEEDLGNTEKKSATDDLIPVVDGKKEKETAIPRIKRREE